MIMKVTINKSINVNDYRLLCMAYPDLEKEIPYKDWKNAKILTNLRSYQLTFTDGVVREVIVPFLEFGAANFAGNANVSCI